MSLEKMYIKTFVRDGSSNRWVAPETMSPEEAFRSADAHPGVIELGVEGQLPINDTRKESLRRVCDDWVNICHVCDDLLVGNRSEFQSPPDFVEKWIFQLVSPRVLRVEVGQLPSSGDDQRMEGNSRRITVDAEQGITELLRSARQFFIAIGAKNKRVDDSCREAYERLGGTESKWKTRFAAMKQY